jgi:DHA1 family purine ribonucleoside efflux pump-like MFS transporter
VLLGLASIVLIAAGHFAAFTYVRPAADLVPGLGSAGLATLLMVFGASAFVGNLVAGPLADARLRTALLLAPVLIGVATIGFALLSEHFGTVLAAVVVWGVGFGGIPTLAQTWVARVEPARLEAASGLVVMMFQVAIASGAVLVEVADVRAALVVGGISAVAGGVLISSTHRDREPVPAAT